MHSDIVAFFNNDMGLVNVDLNNAGLDDDDFDDDDPKTIINVRLMAWCNRYKNCKACIKEISRESLSTP